MTLWWWASTQRSGTPTWLVWLTRGATATTLWWTAPTATGGFAACIAEFPSALLSRLKDFVVPSLHICMSDTDLHFVGTAYARGGMLGFKQL